MSIKKEFNKIILKKNKMNNNKKKYNKDINWKAKQL